MVFQTQASIYGNKGYDFFPEILYTLESKHISEVRCYGLIILGTQYLFANGNYHKGSTINDFVKGEGDREKKGK